MRHVQRRIWLWPLAAFGLLALMGLDCAGGGNGGGDDDPPCFNMQLPAVQGSAEQPIALDFSFFDGCAQPGRAEETISLSATDLPPNSQASFSENPVTKGAVGTSATKTLTLTLNQGSPTPDGSYPIEITATDGRQTVQRTYTAIVGSGPGPDALSITEQDTMIGEDGGDDSASYLATIMPSIPPPGIAPGQAGDEYEVELFYLDHANELSIAVQQSITPDSVTYDGSASMIDFQVNLTRSSIIAADGDCTLEFRAKRNGQVFATEQATLTVNEASGDSSTTLNVTDDSIRETGPDDQAVIEVEIDLDKTVGPAAGDVYTVELTILDDSDSISGSINTTSSPSSITYSGVGQFLNFTLTMDRTSALPGGEPLRRVRVDVKRNGVIEDTEYALLTLGNP